MAGEWETLRSAGWESLKKPTGPPELPHRPMERQREMEDFISRRDPGIDYATGVKNAAFRAAFSRMDNEAEKAQFLDRSIGKGRWGQDSFGAYYINPEGLRTLGIKSDLPVSIDEQTTSRYDLADIAGDAPAIAGATAGGLAATGLGAPAAAGVAGLGAAGGAAIDEIVKNFQGDQVKSAGDVATKLGKEFALGSVGEGVARGIAGATKLATAPHAGRMTPEKRELAASAVEQGFKVRPGTLTDAPILGRWEGMIRQIFGDFHEQANRKAAKQGAERLTSAAGQSVGKEGTGEALVGSIRKQRIRFSEVMGERYKQIDDLVGGQPIVPLDAVKQRARDILEVMPKTESGAVVGGKDKLLKEVLEMPENITVREAQRLRTMFREAAESPDLLPDVAKHDARELKKSVDLAFENAKSRTDVSAQAINMLRSADQAYAKGVQQFDKPVVKAITKDSSKLTVDADMVVDYLVKPERLVRLKHAKKVASPEAWAKVKAVHAQDLIGNLVKGTEDPLVNVFDGKAFRDGLDKYGRAVLEEVHGKEWVDQAYKYANALMLAEKTMKLSGGIVAANVALHPVRNLPKLLWLRAVAHIVEQPGTFKYLTEGIQFGPRTEKFANALTKFASQVAALASDETGSASITLTAPKEPVQ